MKVYKTAYSFLIICLLGLVTSCDINDSYINCETRKPFTVYFRYFADTNDMTNVIGNYINDGVLYVYDSETKNLVNKFTVTKEEFLHGKKIILAEGNYQFVCWGNKSIRSETIDEDQITSSRISSPEFVKGEKILSNDPLYFSSNLHSKRDLTLNNPSNGDSNSDTLTFVSSHINFLIRVHGIKDNRNIRLELTNLMPQYDFEMHETMKFDTSYYPVVSSTVTDNNGNIFYREFNFSVLRFKNDNKIRIRLFDSDTGEQLTDEETLSDFLAKNKIDVERQQELTIFIEYKFTDTGVTVTMKEWVEEEITPGS